MNQPSGSFCPHCQADWARPWYDVCPACGHRFKERPFWQSSWLVVFIICLPAIAILIAGMLPSELLSKIMPGGRENLFVILALTGTGLAALSAGIMTACRLKSTTGMRVLLSFIFVPVFYAVSFFICFFACSVVLNR